MSDDQELIQIRTVHVNEKVVDIFYRHRLVDDEVFEVNGNEKMVKFLTPYWSEWKRAVPDGIEKLNGVKR